MTLSRRSFLRTAAASVSVGGITYFLPPFPARAQNPKPDAIRIGAIGVGNQGRGNLGIHAKNCVAVCEVDSIRLAAAVARSRRRAGRSRRPTRTTASCSNGRTSTPSSSRRRTTGTP